MINDIAIMVEMTEEKAFQRLSALCAKGEQCSYDLERKMKGWGVSDDARRKVMGRLHKERYVDDMRYCEMFVKDKVRFNRWGRRKIEQALWAKRIGEDIYRPILDAVDDNDYKEALVPLLRQKERSLKGGTDYERYCKLLKFAMGRGFTMHIISQCIDLREDEDC